MRSCVSTKASKSKVVFRKQPTSTPCAPGENTVVTPKSALARVTCACQNPLQVRAYQFGCGRVEHFYARGGAEYAHHAHDCERLTGSEVLQGADATLAKCKRVCATDALRNAQNPCIGFAYRAGASTEAQMCELVRERDESTGEPFTCAPVPGGRREMHFRVPLYTTIRGDCGRANATEFRIRGARATRGACRKMCDRLAADQPETPCVGFSYRRDAAPADRVCTMHVTRADREFACDRESNTDAYAFDARERVYPKPRVTDEMCDSPTDDYTRGIHAGATHAACRQMCERITRAERAKPEVPGSPNECTGYIMRGDVCVPRMKYKRGNPQVVFSGCAEILARQAAEARAAKEAAAEIAEDAAAAKGDDDDDDDSDDDED